MVGVPGRSKACHNCRARRRKCDERRPGCSACERLRLHCEGYERRTIFVNSKTVVPERSGSSLPLPVYRRYSPETKSPPVDRSSQDLVRSAYLAKHLEVLWDAYLPFGLAKVPAAARYAPCGWTQIAHEYGDNFQLCRKILVSASMCMIGSQSRETIWLSKQGREMYGEALSGMRAALGKFKESDRYILAVASRLISIHNVFFGGNPRDWPSQARAMDALNKGEQALLLAPGPEAYTIGKAHQIFSDARLDLILPSLLSRQHSVLSEPAWMTVPWKVIPKTPMDLLVDIIATLPGVWQYLVQPEAQATGSQERAMAEVRCQIIAKELVSWHEATRSELTIDRMPVGKGADMSSTDMAKIQLLLLFWTVCFNVSATVGVFLPEVDLPLVFDVQYSLQTALKYLSVLLLPGSGWYGINAAVWSFRAIMETLQETQDPESWQKERAELMAMLRSQAGKQIHKLMISQMQAYGSEDALEYWSD